MSWSQAEREEWIRKNFPHYKWEGYKIGPNENLLKYVQELESEIDTVRSKLRALRYDLAKRKCITKGA
jgi:hypothetical protein